MKSRILILGATGYVGRSLVTRLARSGWAQPVAGVRRAVDFGDVPTVQCEATDVTALTAALRDASAVVSCVAGSAGVMTAHAEALARALMAAPAAPRLVFLSSMAVYGDAVGLVDEAWPLSGTGEYGQAKVTAEKTLARVSDAVVLRPGCIFGPGSPQWTERVGRLLMARRLGDLGAMGDGYSNLVFIDDVTAAIEAALRRPSNVSSSVFNLAMPGAPRWNDYFIAFGERLGAVPVPRIPEWRMRIETRLLAPPLKVLEIVSARLGRREGVPPPIPPSLLRLWGQDIRLDVSKATHGLGVQWTPLDEGLRQATA
ncbi:NAD-dependent epimerase/dehydratase family protein [Pigmentiphaga sp. CHJ604]|uniref:NAD-dependent epimerase/dehydratase family protein n=1 Tax=Pigmentiphaga sp. CHJ604 TaxID=3081984 RepID=UPI0030D5C980